MQSKRSYFLRNLATGWYGLHNRGNVRICKHNINKELVMKFEPLFDNTFLIISIYIISELAVGILPRSYL